MSSETEYPSGNSITSSHSSFNHHSQPKSEINVINSKNNSDKSDSFIVFEESQSCNPIVSNKYDSTTTEKSSHLPRGESADIRNAAGRTSKVYLYIQMQLCQKNSLREWLCDNLVRDQKTVLQMFYEIVQAVEYVHLQGLIHRDLKVSNNQKSVRRKEKFCYLAK